MTRLQELFPVTPELRERIWGGSGTVGSTVGGHWTSAGRLHGKPGSGMAVTGLENFGEVALGPLKGSARLRD